MEFGQWIQQVRLERKMDLRAFAERIGVDISTISRIENMRTQATLATAIRMCEGLGITPSLLVEVLQGTAASDLEPVVLSGHEMIPMLEDVQAFIRSMRRDWRRGSLLLAEMMNTIALLQLQGRRTNRENGRPLFVPEDVDQLLLDIPLYRFEFHYPSDIKTSDIWENYRGGGWITATDVGAYIKKIRREKRVPLVRLQHAVKVSDTVLARLEEGALERIKLNDILLLDEQLEQGGKILVMYWRASQLHEEVMHFLSGSTLRPEDMPLSVWITQQMRLISIFTILCRWFQQEDQKERGWMKELRQQLLQSTSLVEASDSLGERAR
jgi:transcriptional regulator with XRE-family HTH domain